jgi:PEP-CTERM motif
MRIASKLILSIAVLAFFGLCSGAAYADGITVVSPEIQKLVPPLAALNFEHHGYRDSESGGVLWNGTEDISFGDISAGPHQHTILFSDLGINNASQLRVLININEANGGNKAPLTIDSLTITAYDAAGNEVFRATSLGPLTLDQFTKGQGANSDYELALGLDAEAAARLQAAIAADPNLRLGLEASLSNVHGGPERFRWSADCEPTHAPEPATMVLLGTGLASIAGAARRRRRKAAAAKLESETPNN